MYFLGAARITRQHNCIQCYIWLCYMILVFQPTHPFTTGSIVMHHIDVFIVIVTHLHPLWNKMVQFTTHVGFALIAIIRHSFPRDKEALPAQISRIMILLKNDCDKILQKTYHTQPRNTKGPLKNGNCKLKKNTILKVNRCRVLLKGILYERLLFARQFYAIKVIYCHTI